LAEDPVRRAEVSEQQAEETQRPAHLDNGHPQIETQRTPQVEVQRPPQAEPERPQVETQRPLQIEPDGSKSKTPRRERLRRALEAEPERPDRGQKPEVKAPPRKAPRVKPLPKPRPAAQPLPEPEPVPEGFRDLLGQAVGLRLDNVSRVYRLGSVEVRALDSVSMEIAPGEFVAISGPSGCGKSTLLGLLGGLDKPSRGHVYAAGLALDQISEPHLADYRLQRVGTIFQTFNLVPTLDARDNVALPMALAGVPADEVRQRVDRLLDLIGLRGRAKFKPNRLSGGEQQRVAVARALANRPGLVLADEPTGNLDTEGGRVVLDLLSDLHRRGATVVLVTHDPQIARTASRVVRMRDGKVVAGGTARRTPRAPEALDPPHRLRWWEALRAGLRSVRRRPLRTSLTASGVAIGVGVMSVILALAAGLQQALNDSAAAESQLRQVSVPATSADTLSHKNLDEGALAALRGMPHVTSAWGDLVLEGVYSAPGTPPGATDAVLVSMPPRAALPPQQARDIGFGRLPKSDEAAEVVISEQQARRLGYAPSTAPGHKIEFRARYSGLPLAGSAAEAAAQQPPLTLTVAGVTRGRPLGVDIEGGSAPYKVVLAYRNQVAEANGWKAEPFRALVLEADSPGNAHLVRDEALSAGYQAQTVQEQLGGVGELFLYLPLALVGLAIIAFAVACLGIANTMYTAVLERTKEIGVLKALGARSLDVLLLFLAEAAVIGVIGGIVGLLIASGLGNAGNGLISGVARSQGAGSGITFFQLSALIVIESMLISVFLSILSGTLPALQASRLDPVKALHYE
jgi:macrolide transport system ATP-binding/permease protein